MSQHYPKFKAAAVQASPVYLNAKGATARQNDLVETSGAFSQE